MHLWRTKAFSYKSLVPLSHPNKTSNYIQLSIIKSMFTFPSYTTNTLLAVFPKPGSSQNLYVAFWLSLFSLCNDFWSLISYSHFTWLGKLRMTSENFCLKLYSWGRVVNFSARHLISFIFSWVELIKLDFQCSLKFPNSIFKSPHYSVWSWGFHSYF